MRLVTSGCTIRLSPYMAGNDCVYEIFDSSQSRCTLKLEACPLASSHGRSALNYPRVYYVATGTDHVSLLIITLKPFHFTKVV